MKVYISNYRDHWISPYTIMEKLLFWKKWTDPEFDLYADKNEKYTNWLVKPCQLLHKVLDFVRPQIRYVKLDRYDTWNMDGTLAVLILPMLVQLKATKQGSAHVDPDDVPALLRPTEEAGPDNGYTDNTIHQRWDWVMDELIWTFTQLHPDTDWEAQYHSGEHDILWTEDASHMYPNPVTGVMEPTYRMERGPRDTHVWDQDGHAKHDARISNGLRLFGKYYRGLWD